MKFTCRRCAQVFAIDLEGGWDRIQVIQEIQCPIALDGIGHWLKAEK